MPPRAALQQFPPCLLTPTCAAAREVRSGESQAFAPDVAFARRTGGKLWLWLKQCPLGEPHVSARGSPAARDSAGSPSSRPPPSPSLQPCGNGPEKQKFAGSSQIRHSRQLLLNQPWEQEQPQRILSQNHRWGPRRGSRPQTEISLTGKAFIFFPSLSSLGLGLIIPFSNTEC